MILGGWTLTAAAHHVLYGHGGSLVVYPSRQRAQEAAETRQVAR